MTANPSCLPEDNRNVDRVPPAAAERTLESMREVFGRKWHLVVLYHLLSGESKRFSELQSEIAGISGKVLSESLSRLEETGVVDRSVVNERPVRVEYETTDQGEALEPVIAELIAIGRELEEVD